MNIFTGRTFTHVETSGDFPGDPDRYAKTIYKVVARFDEAPDEEYVSVRSFDTEEAADAHLERVEEFGPERADFVDSDKWYTQPRFENRDLEAEFERGAQRERERRRLGRPRY